MTIRLYLTSSFYLVWIRMLQPYPDLYHYFISSLINITIFFRTGFAVKILLSSFLGYNLFKFSFLVMC